MRKLFGIGIMVLAFGVAAGCAKKEQVRAERSAGMVGREQPAQAQADRDPMPGQGQGRPMAEPGMEQPGSQPGGPAMPTAPGSPFEARMTTMDLSDHGIDATLMAPEGSSVRSEFGAVKVMHGPRFNLELYTQAADLQARKSEILSSGIQRFRRYVTDTPDTLVYEVESLDEMGQGEFHFVANVTAGGKALRCEDTRGVSYSLDEVQAMLQACQSLSAM